MEREKLKRANEIDTEITQLDRTLEKLEAFKDEARKANAPEAYVTLSYNINSLDVTVHTEKEVVFEIIKMLDKSIIQKRSALFEELEKI